MTNSGPVRRLVINRPEVRNALRFETMSQLCEALTQAKLDSTVRVVVLEGAGDRAFCAGADLVGKEGGGIASENEAADANRGQLADVFRLLRDLGKPSIAKVRGYCLAGGFGLAMACDLVVAADDAVFGTPEIKVGLWPYMITVPLQRVIPGRVLLELMMTGRRLSASEAVSLGIVNRVVPAEELEIAVAELSASLSNTAPLTMEYGRESFFAASGMDFDAALQYLQGMLSKTLATEDAIEGVTAFAEKRDPQWKGR
jgi:enoyl-CoA hydratase/carnithine racemase